jgi:YdjC-like protein
VRRECRAQIERALAWGIDVTHLAPHLTAITLRPEFFDVYLDMAVDFRLPIRLPSTITADQAGFPFRRLADRGGRRVPLPLRPRLAGRQPGAGAARNQDARARVTEIHVQAGNRHTRGVRGRDSRGPSLNECYAHVWSCWLACKWPRERTVYVFSRHTATDELNLF